ncbi:MAG: TRAP transporter small permease [Deltaproteobacteria bacterium]|nr:TRAP transporter small permease [Deltaproteobacteria bacterium]
MLKTTDSVVRRLSLWMYWVAGVALTGIVFLTVTDVFMRFFKHPILGSYELVGFLGATAIGFSLPQTSLNKGQVLMDFVIHRLNKSAQTVLLVLTRLLGLGLFIIIGVNLLIMGQNLRVSGEVSLTLNIPQYPLAYGLALACFVQSLVLIIQMFPEKAGSK